MNKSEVKSPPTRHLSTWFIKGGVILIILLVLWIGRHHLLGLLNFLRNREAVVAYLEPLGIWGPLLYLFILAVQVFTAIIPGHALMIAAGYLYGFAGGFTLNVIGAVVVSQLAFVLARRAGRPAVQRLVPANVLDRWDNVAKQQGFFFFLICFWFPIIPSNTTNYIAGLSPISFRLFFLANFLGRLPGLILVTLIGSHGLELTWQQWSIILPVAVIMVIGGRYLTAKIERRFSVHR
ncbi:TVP38/TMEM64 family protein [Chloroflexota bacterium]